jgi:hypothetical protein
MRPPKWLSAAALGAALGVTLGLSACDRDTVARYGADPFTRDLPPVTPLGGKIVTSNVGDDTLSVLDPMAPGPAGRLPVGFNPVEIEGPHHLAADPLGRFVYVNLSFAVMGSGSGPHGVHGSGDQPGFVVKLDTATGRELDRVQVDPNPGDSVLSGDGALLYVTHYDAIKWRRGGGASNLVVIDTSRMVVVQRRALCPAAHGVRLSRAGTILYATCGPDQMAVVDLRVPGLPVRLVSVPLAGAPDATTCNRCPYALAVAPDDTVWLSNLGPNAGLTGRGSVEVYDPNRPAASGEVGDFDPMRRVPMRGRPVFAAFVTDAGVPGGYRALIPEQAGPGDAVHVLAPGSPGVAPALLSRIDFDPRQCLNAHMMLVDAAGVRAQLICEGDQRGPGGFVWLDLLPGGGGATVLGAVPTGVFPDGLVLVPHASPPSF